MDASEIGLALAAPAALQAGLAAMAEALAALDGAAEAVWADALGVGPLGLRGGGGAAPADGGEGAEPSDEGLAPAGEGRVEAVPAGVRRRDVAGPTRGARRDSVSDRADGGRERSAVASPRSEGSGAGRGEAARVGSDAAAGWARRQMREVLPRTNRLPRAAAPGGRVEREGSHERLDGSDTGADRAARRASGAAPRAAERAPGLGRGVAAAPVHVLPEEGGAAVVSRVADVIGLLDGDVAGGMDAGVAEEVGGAAEPRRPRDIGGSARVAAIGWPIWDGAASTRAVAPVDRERSPVGAGVNGRGLGSEGQGSPGAGLMSAEEAAPGGEGRKAAEDLAPVLELDGRVIGQWLGERMAREASRPAGGTTFFDPRQAPAWMPSGSL